jgi:hypothetical protein
VWGLQIKIHILGADLGSEAYLIFPFILITILTGEFKGGEAFLLKRTIPLSLDKERGIQEVR